ncbi:MAG: hydroxymethylglutaryl-CoA reductase, degradative [Bacteroidetes bacterium]|nr:hydroxymethylglutaryl-CoA reductase, degradative [Bacteroidota bacterium]
MKGKIIKGFSKLSGKEKRHGIASLCKKPEAAEKEMESYLAADPATRKKFLELSENTISSFHVPYGIAPNVMIDGRIYHVPMAIEESSVIAAASHAARFWAERGGFRVKQISTVKLGHVYFRWFTDPRFLSDHWDHIRFFLLDRLRKTTASMVRRGGGVLELRLIDSSEIMENLYKLELELDTVNSMGANFINTCLEELAEGMDAYLSMNNHVKERRYQHIMSILSNFTEKCTITVEASCSFNELKPFAGKLPVEEFAEKIQLAYGIAKGDPYRAATHNKGIMNGVDAVLLATGNDYRAAEAAAHAYASREGVYQALSSCRLKDRKLTISLTIPLAIGTVGGITNLHPLARLSLEILGNPNARELMAIVAAVGLSSNFAALTSLVTTGIQKGHMRLHLSNILNSLNAGTSGRRTAEEYFTEKKISYDAVKHFVDARSN